MQPIHVLILATTSWVIHSCAFLFVLYIFFDELVWLTVGLYCTEVLCEKFPTVATDSLVFLPRFGFFFLLQKLSFFILFTAKAYLIFAVPSQNSLPPPSPLYLLHAVVRLIKLPLVALESQGDFNESALKWLLACDSKSVLQSEPFLSVLAVFRMGVFISHIQGEVVLPALCWQSKHLSLSCGQPESYTTIYKINMKYFTFPCEHI